MSEVIHSRIVYSGHVINLRVDDVRSPSGKIILREVIEHAGAVAIVALDADDNVLLVRQHRHATGKDLLEIPAGGIDAGETPEESVLREMQEETGFMPQKIIRLGGIYSAPGFSNEYLHLFLAENLTPARLFAEDTDEISLEKVPLGEIGSYIDRGVIEDAKSVAALLLYLRYKKAPSTEFTR